VAAEVQKVLGEPVTLEVGTVGEFTVWVGDQVVVEKTTQRFPEPDEVLRAIRAARTA
jgi:predicted Rdx family selenoprotein